MPTSRTRRQFAFASIAASVVLASCGKKEQPPPPVAEQAPPTLAPSTTLPAPTPVPTPPLVWRSSRWGMTKEEVLAAFPGEAQRLQKPVAFGQAKAGTGALEATSEVSIPAYESDGVTFRVLFGFAADALDRVHLAAAKAGPATCSDLERTLTAKHTAPSGRENMEGSLRGERITWRRPDQTITLACAGVASLGFQRVTLDYMAPNADPPKN